MRPDVPPQGHVPCLLRLTWTPEGPGMGAKGHVSWTPRPQEAGHSHTRIHWAQGQQQQQQQRRLGSPWHPHCWTRAGRQAGDTQLHARDPSGLPHWEAVFERGPVGAPSTSNLQLQPGGLWPCEAVRVVTFTLGPLAPPAPRQIFAPLKAVTTRSWHPHKRPCLCRTGPPGQVAPKETAEHRRPEKQIPPAELRKSQGSFP